MVCAGCQVESAATDAASARPASTDNLCVAGPVPEDPFWRSRCEQGAHILSEVVRPVTEEVWCRRRQGEIAGQDAFAVSDQIGDTRDEQRVRSTEACSHEHVFEAMHPRRENGLAGALCRAEITFDQRVDFVVWDRRWPRARRSGPAGNGVGDQSQGSAGLQRARRTARMPGPQPASRSRPVPSRANRSLRTASSSGEYGGRPRR
jgi:hypothetical protein